MGRGFLVTGRSVSNSLITPAYVCSTLLKVIDDRNSSISIGFFLRQLDDADTVRSSDNLIFGINQSSSVGAGAEDNDIGHVHPATLGHDANAISGFVIQKLLGPAIIASDVLHARSFGRRC